jgi:DNA-binding GntR family transcriptional regulator
MPIALSGSRRRSATEEAYDYLHEMIRTGRLEGGTHVTSEEVARSISMSRIPVREAMRQLATEGYMTIRSNRGAVVTSLSSDEVMELYEMRAVLEGLAFRDSIAALDARSLAECERGLSLLEQARHDPDWFVAAHNALHDALGAGCRRRRLMQEILRLRTAAEPYLRMTIRMSPTAFSNTVAEHEVLVRCAKERDTRHAEAVMRAHILGGDIDLILASAGLSEKAPRSPADVSTD